MRKGVIAGMSVLAVAVIGYVGFNAWIAFVPPARPVGMSAALAPECEKLEWRGNAFAGSPWECQKRVEEAERLKLHPGLAVRSGDSLTLFYRGMQSAHLVPITARRMDDADCDSYLVHKVLAVHDHAANRSSAVAQISCHRGEFEERFVAMPDGSRWIVGDAASSPGGKLIATGQNWLDFEASLSPLKIVTWPDRKVVARFQQRCRVLEWQDDSRFTVTCSENLLSRITARHNWYIAYDAKVWRDKRGRWQMQATRWLKPRWDYNDAGDLEYLPQFSLLPLPGFTAEQPS